mgnify:CR=1 FL=1
MKTLILNAKEVLDLLDMKEVLPAVEEGFAAHGRGETIMPPKVYLPLEEYHGDFRAMPVSSSGSAGVKWVNSHPRNPQDHGIPSVLGVFILSDPVTARPLAIMDATSITAYRTGASAAVATKHLAKEGAVSVGFVGCGVQAETALSAIQLVREISELKLYDRSEASALRFASTFTGNVCSLEEVSGCDVIVTMTPSREPIVKKEWLSPGAHINAMGADAPGKQELDPAILSGARVFLDDREQGSESGEVNVALHTGLLKKEDLAGTLGEVVAGSLPGRADSGVTVFDSTGLAVQDLAVARVLYQKATEKGMGLSIDLVGA